MGYDDDRDMLGEEQWNWLTEELKTNQAEYVLIGSGVQILPDDRIIIEYWFANSRQKLLAMLKKYNINGAVLLSGDIHWGELLEQPCWKYNFGYPLYELTSSGLTHNPGIIIPLLNKIVTNLFPKTFSDRSNMYVGFNFGSIIVEFPEHHQSKISLQIRNIDGMVVIEKNLTQHDLTFHLYTPKNDIDKKCILDTPASTRAWRNLYTRFKNFEWEIWLSFTFLLSLLFLILFILKILVFKILKMMGIIKQSLKKKVE